MLKTTAKIILAFVLITAIAIATGIATYFITIKLMPKETPSPANARNSLPDAADVERQSPHRNEVSEKISAVQYTVCLEGNALGIYITRDGTREFLCRETIHPENLSPGDIQLLRQGVTFDSIAEFTAFIENFTS